MSDRLASAVLVGAMLRRVNDAGGFGAVLAKGESQGGAILILTAERGGNACFFEPGIGPDGRMGLIRSGPGEPVNGADLTDYWQRRRRSDPDLWVIELDIAGAERFAAETIFGD
jgi:hypothetical protein